MILNLTSGGSQDQVAEFCRLGVIKPLCDLLAAEDAKLITVILDALSNILRVGCSLLAAGEGFFCLTGFRVLLVCVRKLFVVFDA